jgi:hypothetical protein
MLTLVLISCYTAFLFAVVNQIYSMFEAIIDLRAIRAITCLGISASGTALANVLGVKDFIIHSVSAAFLASLLVIIAERLNTYQPAVIRAIGTER